MHPTQDFGYVINRRPYRENSFLVDVFTAGNGLFRCVARVAKQRGKILKGALEPFIYSQLQWSGKSELPTLHQIDEKARHKLDSQSLLKSFYMNELLLRLLLPNQNDPALFQQYRQQLNQLPHDAMALIHFELQLLDSLGHSLIYPDTVDPKQHYHYVPEVGFIEPSHSQAKQSSIIISGFLLLSLQNQHYPAEQAMALRALLDQMFQYCLAGKPLNSRKMLRL